MRTTRCSLLTSAVIILFSLLSCSGGGYVSFSGYAQGGVYTIKYNASGVDLPLKAVRDSVEGILASIDNSISGYNGNSLLSRFNAGEEIVPDEHFQKLLEMSEMYRELSGGAFDAAAGPLFDIWGFGFSSDSLPSPKRVEEALAECRGGHRLNFNAIAQGYSCDVVAAFLYRIGVHDMLVDIGEIYCDGVNASGKGWSVGVDDPYDGNDTPGESLRGIWTSSGGPCGIVTSGNYRKFYVVDGKKYAHTIDPRTGYPVQHNLLSATVVAPTAAQADALATCCMVMGAEEAAAFIGSIPLVEAYFITSDGVWTSDGFTLSR